MFLAILTKKNELFGCNKVQFFGAIFKYLILNYCSEMGPLQVFAFVIAIVPYQNYSNTFFATFKGRAFKVLSDAQIGITFHEKWKADLVCVFNKLNVYLV